LGIAVSQDEVQGEIPDEPFPEVGHEEIVHDNEGGEEEQGLTETVQLRNQSHSVKVIQDGQSGSDKEHDEVPNTVECSMPEEAQDRHEYHQCIAARGHHPDHPVGTRRYLRRIETGECIEDDNGEKEKKLQSHLFPSLVGVFGSASPRRTAPHEFLE
jgi:hypothetical protein